MDTREKIVPARDIRAPGPVTLIIGYFDPLHALHVRQVRELSGGEAVVIAVDDPPDPLLPRSARVELAASLTGVCYVVADPEGALSTLQPARVHDLRDEHLRYRETLSAHVRRRHSTE